MKVSCSLIHFYKSYGTFTDSSPICWIFSRQIAIISGYFAPDSEGVKEETEQRFRKTQWTIWSQPDPL